MAKPQGRKPRKRPAAFVQSRPKLDPELAELARALDDRRVDSNAAGWFSIPWRDGWNAASLACEAYQVVDATTAPTAESTIGADARELIEARRSDATTYWNAGEWLVELGASAPLLRAALRCVQVLISNSHGGGEVYNAILRSAFEVHIPEHVEHLVEKHRCLDVLGPEIFTGSPAYTYRARMFAIAWRRGLYQAAYAV